MPPDSEPQADEVVVALVNLFQTFMGLDADQVVIYNTDWNIPADNRLYLTLGLLATRPFGSSNTKRNVDAEGPQIGGLPIPGKLIETITVQTQETYTVNIFSSTNEAMLRNWEIGAALNSTMGQQAQETAGFSVATNPLSVTDLSQVEGASRLFRYVVTIPLLRSRTRENVVEFFDQFPGSPALLIEP